MSDRRTALAVLSALFLAACGGGSNAPASGLAGPPPSAATRARLLGGAPIGIPYVVVSGSQGRVNIVFNAYGRESDPGPYPVPATAPVEGGSAASNTGDRHVLVIVRDNNRLYELDSADAAGLPIFPGLARCEEAAAEPGGIRHALRFTVQRSRRAWVPPASHFASSNLSATLPPMGMRVRLKADYAIPASFSVETRALLTAMKTYGMIVADNGSNRFVSGAPDDRWDDGGDRPFDDEHVRSQRLARRSAASALEDFCPHRGAPLAR